MAASSSFLRLAQCRQFAAIAHSTSGGRRSVHLCRTLLSSASDSKPDGSDSQASTKSHWYIKMPSISEQEKFGKVAKWKKQEGDKVKTGDQLCEIEFTNFSINLNMEEDSYVAQIMVPAGDGEVPVGSPLCALVEKQEDIGPFRAAHAPQANKKDFGFTQKDIMTTINHMLKAAQIDEELAGQLLSLARHENLELYEAFNGSFEGKEFSEQGLEGLDTSFFLLQAKDIVKTTLAPAQQESKPAAEQNKPAPEQSKPAAEP